MADNDIIRVIRANLGLIRAHWMGKHFGHTEAEQNTSEANPYLGIS